MATHLLLVRHGSTGTQDPPRYIGSSDVPLTERGRAEALSLGPLLQAWRPTRCFCSPLSRAQDTAALANGTIGLIVETDPELREIDFGSWEGKTFAEIAAEAPDAVARWADALATFRFPAGEAVADFTARVAGAAERLAADPAETVLAVTHGGVVRAMICHLLGLQPEHHVLFDIPPATLAVIRLYGDRGVLVRLSPPALDGV